MRDNQGMALVPAGLVHQVQLDAEIKSAIRKLGPEAAQVSYGLGADSTGEPSVFFRIVLTDAAAREEALADVTERIGTILFDQLRPMENWGLHAYFNFRSYSEHQSRNDPEWAA